MTSWRDVKVDARGLACGAVTVHEDGAIVVTLPYRLESPNATVWKHWRVKQREKKAWAARLRLALLQGRRLSADALAHPIAILGLPPVTRRRRVRIVREVPSRRNFIRDDDNLAFAGKHLLDALAEIGLIKDDARAWCELVRPEQKVSDDKRDRVVIRVEIPEGETIPLRTVHP